MISINDIRERIYVLEGVLDKINCAGGRDVSGRLDIRRQRGRYYYNVINDVEDRKYIRVVERNTAVMIAKRDYLDKMEKLVNSEKAVLKKLLGIYSSSRKIADNLYNNLHPARKELLKPLLLSDEEYVDRWLSMRSESKNVYDISSEIYTEAGEHVRSKTEKIIADKLYSKGIPYKYEEPLNISGGIYYPDFTILCKGSRKEIYWEHFGLLDDPEYRNHMLQKIETYARAGITVSSNLIMTFESSSNPLSTKVIEKIIDEMI